jgi:arylsulfatase A-like enzyme
VANRQGRTFFSSPYTDLLVGTVHENWKYIYNAEQEKDELYDLSVDPDELRNVAHLYPEKVETERTYVAAWVQYQKETFKNWKE